MEADKPTFCMNKDIFLTFTSLSSCLEAAYLLITSIKYKEEHKQNYWDHYAIWESIEKLFEPVLRNLHNHFTQWQFLEQQEDRYFCRHTIGTLCILYKDLDFVELSYADQNILMWTMIFHDIHKRGRPLVHCRDPFHPFPCASKALEIFTAFNSIPVRPGLKEFCAYMESAYVLDENTNIEIMDYSKLEVIFRGLLYYTWIIPEISENFSSYSELESALSEEQRHYFEIIVLILFHQSLDLNPVFPIATCLSLAEVSRFLSKRLVKLLYIVHKADHNSYNIGRYEYNTWPNDRAIHNRYLFYLSQF